MKPAKKKGVLEEDLGWVVATLDRDDKNEGKGHTVGLVDDIDRNADCRILKRLKLWIKIKVLSNTVRFGTFISHRETKMMEPLVLLDASLAS